MSVLLQVGGLHPHTGYKSDAFASSQVPVVEPKENLWGSSGVTKAIYTAFLQRVNLELPSEVLPAHAI